MSLGRPWNRSWRQVEQWSFQLHLHALQSPSPIQPSLPPSKQPPARPSSPVGQLSLPMRQLIPLRPACCSKIFPSPPQPWRSPSTARRLPFAHEPPRACQSLPSTVEEGLDLHLSYHKHIWRLATIKTVSAWRLPSTTALCQWTFCG